MEDKIKNVVYKAPNGKLLRVKFALDNDMIKSIKIRGDFFIHPEFAILDIERFLIGKDINFIVMTLTEFLASNNITIIGFKPEDIFKIISDNNLS